MIIVYAHWKGKLNGAIREKEKKSLFLDYLVRAKKKNIYTLFPYEVDSGDCIHYIFDVNTEERSDLFA